MLIQQTDWVPKEGNSRQFLTKCFLIAGFEKHAKSPDMGHILAGSQIRPPAEDAASGSQNWLPLLEHPIEQLTTPQKPGSPAEAGTQAFSYSDSEIPCPAVCNSQIVAMLMWGDTC